MDSWSTITVTGMDRTPQRSNASTILRSPPSSPWTAERVDAVLRSYGLLGGANSGSKKSSSSPYRPPRYTEQFNSHVSAIQSSTSLEKKIHSQQRLDLCENEIEKEDNGLRDVSSVPTTPTSHVSGSGSKFRSIPEHANTNSSGELQSILKHVSPNNCVECSTVASSESTSRITSTTGVSSKSMRCEDINDMFRAVQNWQNQGNDPGHLSNGKHQKKSVSSTSKACFTSPFSATYMGVFKDEDERQENETPLVSPNNSDDIFTRNESSTISIGTKIDDRSQEALESYLSHDSTTDTCTLDVLTEERRSQINTSSRQQKHIDLSTSKQQPIIDHSSRIKELELKLYAEVKAKDYIEKQYESLKQKYAATEALLRTTKQSLSESERRNSALYRELEKLGSMEIRSSSKSLTSEFQNEGFDREY